MTTRYLKLITNDPEKGLSLVETILSLVALSVSLLVMTSGINLIQGQRQRAEILSRGLSLETHILSSLGELSIYEETYDSENKFTFRELLQAGLRPLGLTIDLSGRPVATVGHIRTLDMDYQSCQLGESDCHFQVELDIECPAGEDSPCFAAHRISFENLPGRTISLRPLGAAHSSSGFDPKDYNYPINFERIIREKQVSCPPENPIMIGFDRETGEPFCTRIADREPCPQGTIFAGFKVEGGLIQGTCNNTRSVFCPNPFTDNPNPYVLEKVSVGSHDGMLGFFDGQCIFLSEEEGDWSLNSSHFSLSSSDSAQVEFSPCPGPYYVSSHHPATCKVRPANLESSEDESLSYEATRLPKNLSQKHDIYLCTISSPTTLKPEWIGHTEFVAELSKPGEAKCIWDPDLEIQKRIPALEREHYD